jgi:DNA topoisomerase IB
LHNTRAVARDHYVHPHVLATFTEGTFGERLAVTKPLPRDLLEPDEQILAGFLRELLQTEQAG